jgi:porphobilinogen deaminase
MKLSEWEKEFDKKIIEEGLWMEKIGQAIHSNKDIPGLLEAKDFIRTLANDLIDDILGKIQSAKNVAELYQDVENKKEFFK